MFNQKFYSLLDKYKLFSVILYQYTSEAIIMKNKASIILIVLTLVLSSCSKNLLYLSDLEKQKIENLIPSYTPYHLQPYDYLDITITTTDEKINKLFSSLTQNKYRLQQQNPGGYYFFSGYMVNDSGYIYVPLIGHFFVMGKTIDQVHRMIQQRIDSILTDAFVRVKLISYQIFFIGEVNQSRTFYKDRVNILEAISEIGGLPYSADKKHVFVLRRQDTTLKVFTIDLTTKHMIENQNFYLQPYDIVYIRPRGSQIFRIQTQDYYIIVSLITTTASIVSLILSLKK